MRISFTILLSLAAFISCNEKTSNTTTAEPGTKEPKQSIRKTHYPQECFHLDTLKQWRSSQATVATEVLAAVALHDHEHNEDWVSTWTKNVWTYHSGGRDSIMANENWKFVKGKIVYSSASEAKVPADK